jgi:Cu2+-exporting ATPase
MAAHSRHPLSQALVRNAGGTVMPFAHVTETAGGGVEALLGSDLFRLGSAAFACGVGNAAPVDESPLSEVVLAKNGSLIARFYFDDTLRAGAAEAVARLEGEGLHTVMVSGDRQSVVDNTAAALKLGRALGDLTPRQKVEEIGRFSEAGHRILMVGDGINDAPALAAAHVSMAPSSASDVGRQAADLVFFNERLDVVPQAIEIARRSATLIRQNFALAIGYNALAVPVAIAGLATPLIAAVAMSTSSLIVVANALRLARSANASQPDRNAATAAHFKAKSA